jgi:hypothetical protein
MKALRMMLHLSKSLNPRTFHDTTREKRLFGFIEEIDDIVQAQGPEPNHYNK